MLDSHPELLALLEAVKDEPDDDTPRLILADWLDDHGDGPRAEFIRLQLQLARTKLAGEGVQEMRDRAQSLETRYRHRWLGPLTSPVVCRFRRGLVDLHVHTLFPTDDIPQRPEVHAWIESASLTNWTRWSLTDLAQSSLLAGLVDLRIELKEWSPGLWSRFTRSPHLNRLRSFGGTHIGDDDLAEMAAMPCWPHLHTLDLTGNAFSVEAVKVLNENAPPASLHTLLLASNRLLDTGLIALASSSRWEGLTHLDVVQNGIRDWGVAALAGSRHLAGLEVINLAANPLSILGARELARASRLRPRVLGLSRTGLGNAGVAALVRSPVVAKVEDLDLSQNHLGTSGLRVLAESPHLRRLERLDLGYNRMSDDAAALLAEASELTGLRHLNLQGNSIGDAGVKALLDSPTLVNLATLDCDRSRLNPRLRGRLRKRFPDASA